MFIPPCAVRGSDGRRTVPFGRTVCAEARRECATSSATPAAGACASAMCMSMSRSTGPVSECGTRRSPPADRASPFQRAYEQPAPHTTRQSTLLTWLERWRCGAAPTGTARTSVTRENVNEITRPTHGTAVIAHARRREHQASLAAASRPSHGAIDAAVDRGRSLSFSTGTQRHPARQDLHVPSIRRSGDESILASDRLSKYEGMDIKALVRVDSLKICRVPHAVKAGHRKGRRQGTQAHKGVRRYA